MTADCRHPLHPHPGTCPLPASAMLVFGFSLRDESPVPTDAEMVPASAVSAMEKYRPAASGTLTCCDSTWKLEHDGVEERLCWMCGQEGRELNSLSVEERAGVPSPSPSHASMDMSQSRGTL